MGGPGGRGLEAAGHAEDVFRADLDVAFVGIGLPASQELDICIRDADLLCPSGCALAEGVAGIVPWYTLLS